MRFTTSVVLIFGTVASFFSHAAAVPVQSGAAVVFDPEITFPTGGEVFNAGENITVQWDVSKLLKGSNDQGLIVLARPEFNSEHLDFNHILANGFLLNEGQQDIVFPSDLPTANNYAIVLFGDSGNISPEFTIKSS